MLSNPKKHEYKGWRGSVVQSNSVLNAQVSDTTDDESSNAARYQKALQRFFTLIKSIMEILPLFISIGFPLLKSLKVPVRDPVAVSPYRAMPSCEKVNEAMLPVLLFALQTG